jgi:proteasome accessory factor C
MDKFDRIFELHKIFNARRTPISQDELMAKLECSRATLHRAITLLKDTLNAPVTLRNGGYLYARERAGEVYELPGLWFTPAELQALAVMQRLLQDAGGGLLEEHLGALSRRLAELTQHQRLYLGEAASRLRFPAIAARPPGDQFTAVTAATLQRKKLWFEYHARSTNTPSERTVSPQRITHYRDTWYLDAWDDDKDQLRTFAVDRIRRAKQLEDKALDVPEAQLDEHYASSYGIFGGKADKLAVLRFTAERARWVADERWHPQQQGAWLDDGRYELRIPYRESRELVMDILRHGAAVEVVAPALLREQVGATLRAALALYEHADGGSGA